MGFLTPEQVRKIELHQWKFPSELGGLVYDSFAALKQRLPQDKEFDSPFLLDTLDGDGAGYERYARKHSSLNLTFLVAYGCHSCQKVVVGNPRILPVDLGSVYRDKVGLSISCSHCSACLDSL